MDRDIVWGDVDADADDGYGQELEHQTLMDMPPPVSRLLVSRFTPSRQLPVGDGDSDTSSDDGRDPTEARVPLGPPQFGTLPRRFGRVADRGSLRTRGERELDGPADLDGLTVPPEYAQQQPPRRRRRRRINPQTQPQFGLLVSGRPVVIGNLTAADIVEMMRRDEEAAHRLGPETAGTVWSTSVLDRPLPPRRTDTPSATSTTTTVISESTRATTVTGEGEADEDKEEEFSDNTPGSATLLQPELLDTFRHSPRPLSPAANIEADVLPDINSAPFSPPSFGRRVPSYRRTFHPYLSILQHLPNFTTPRNPPGPHVDSVSVLRRVFGQGGMQLYHRLRPLLDPNGDGLISRFHDPDQLGRLALTLPPVGVRTRLSHMSRMREELAVGRQEADSSGAWRRSDTLVEEYELSHIMEALETPGTLRDANGCYVLDFGGIEDEVDCVVAGRGPELDVEVDCVEVGR